MIRPPGCIRVEQSGPVQGASFVFNEADALALAASLIAQGVQVVAVTKLVDWPRAGTAAAAPRQSEGI